MNKAARKYSKKEEGGEDEKGNGDEKKDGDGDEGRGGRKGRGGSGRRRKRTRMKTNKELAETEKRRGRARRSSNAIPA